ncbi:hypothetical protein [Shewanella surugensis]|uniref:Uncharacterized protein n=1 Tax=Shewanella surugensis TaxID=212020 RepID=A0ABT0LK39_9GAMM|nr:hypothetical protein [Shewanella surugensis]MCL1128072.1 hypothetical protein [Shewanella surugensis]
MFNILSILVIILTYIFGAACLHYMLTVKLKINKASGAGINLLNPDVGHGIVSDNSKSILNELKAIALSA